MSEIASTPEGAASPTLKRDALKLRHAIVISVEIFAGRCKR